MVAALLPGGRADIALGTMRAQWEALAEALESGDAFTSQHAAECWMNHGFQKTLCEKCAAESWLVAPTEVVDACQTALCLGNTKVIEDDWQRARSMEDRAQCSKAVSPQTVWFTQIQRGVASSIHKYPEVSYQDIDHRHAASLPRSVNQDDFHPAAKGQGAELNFSSLVGAAKPEWYSPSPAGAAAQHAHVALWMHCVRHPAAWKLMGKK